MSLDEWLGSVPGLQNEGLERARHMFSQYSVDNRLLDFLISDDGVRVLKRYSENPAKVECAPAPLNTSQAASDEQRPEQAASIEVTPSSAAKSTTGQRQRFSTEDRRNERHYFAQGQSRSSGRNAGVSKGSKQGTASAAKEAPHPQEQPCVVVTTTTPTRSALPSPLERDLLTAAMQTPEKPQEIAMVVEAEPVAYVKGWLKSFNPDTGYGFMKCEGIHKDIFVRRSDFPPESCIDVGRVARFRIEYNAKQQPQARQIVWESCTPISVGTLASVPLVASRAVSDRRFLGSFKSVGEKCGFIESEEVRSELSDSRDIYVAPAQVPQGVKAQTKVSFVLAFSSKGQPQAREIIINDGKDSEAAARKTSSVESQTGQAEGGNNHRTPACELPTVGDSDPQIVPAPSPASGGGRRIW